MSKGGWIGWLTATTLALLPTGLVGQQAPAQGERARDLGIPLHGTPGPLDAITDVAGVEVGHATIISGDGPLKVGEGPVRTGVTAVLPRGRASTTPVFAGWSTLNAAGEMTGTVWLEERGLLEGPVVITNTHSVGVARDTTIGWMLDRGWKSLWFAPVVAETYDGVLNDINGFHVKPQHVREALDGARSGPVREGAVGGGTGMICNRFKGGIGTASRVVEHRGERFTVGVLVQCNYGDRRGLRIAGAPVGSELADRYLPCNTSASGDGRRACPPAPEPSGRARDGSIIVVIATDAPLLPHQLKRLSKRAGLGLGRMGSVAAAGSGDIFIAFSTANPGLTSVQQATQQVAMFPNEDLTPLFEAAVDSTEEAIINAMLAADDMVGANGVKVHALPHGELRAIMRRWSVAQDARRR